MVRDTSTNLYRPLTPKIGPSFWDQKFFAVTRLDHISFLQKLPNLPLNESFMVFGAFGMAFNIISR